jgi:hypothetical protein
MSMVDETGRRVVAESSGTLHAAAGLTQPVLQR